MAGQIDWRGSPSTVGAPPSSRMSSTGTTTSRSSCLPVPASTIVTSRSPPRKPRHLLQRPLGGRQPDPLHGRPGQVVQPLQRQGQVGAALGGGDGVDLVDDHRLHVRQHLARRRGQHQVERLGGGDQDVGRIPADGRPLALGGVAGADARRSGGAGVIPASGARRFFSMSWLSAFSGETYSTRVPRSAGSGRARRGPTGTRPASCPSRSVPASACGCRRRSRASPAAARGWAPRTCAEPVANRRAEGREGVAAHTCNLLPGASDGRPRIDVRQVGNVAIQPSRSGRSTILR